MCFIHSEISRRTFIEQFSLGAAAATAIAGVGSTLAAASEGVAVAGTRPPDVVVAQAPPTGGAKTIDEFSKVLHNRFNQDIPGVATVREGEAVQFLCRDALDIGTAARTLTPNGILTLDLAKVHPTHRAGRDRQRRARRRSRGRDRGCRAARRLRLRHDRPALGLFGGLRE